MLQRINSRWCAAATMAVLITAVSGPAGAQPREEQRALVDSTAPAPAVSMQMYNGVDAWVRRWQTPMDPMGQTALAAAAVTLRYEGVIVGRGVAVASDPAGGTGILMMAAGRAMSEAKERLPIQRDALEEESLRAAAARVAITMELAGRLVPISPDDYPDAINLVAPGLEGVAVRMGEKIEAMFPERMLCTGTDAAAALRTLVSKVSDDPELALKKPGELRGKNGLEFYRFRVSALGQAGEGKQPGFLQRGGRVVRLGDLGTPALRFWADELARHLVLLTDAAGADPAPVLMNPLTGTPEAEASGRTERAVIAYALGVYARGRDLGLGSWSSRSPFDEASAKRCRELVDGILAASRDDLAADPTAAAATFQALSAASLVSSPSDPPFAREIVDAVIKAAASGFDMERGWSSAVPEAGRAIVAVSLADDFVWGSSPARRDLIPVGQAAVGSIFRETTPGRLAAHMPWLGYAENSIARDKPDVPAAAALREMRSQVWQHQLTSTDVPADAVDLAGGIIFTSTRQPLPTWQAARPLAFIAMMLGDPRLTEEKEIPAETARLVASLRFLKQLTASEVEAHMYASPRLAIGGVRASLFDQRMPPEATAMTLITVCETLKSLEAIQARHGEERGK